MPPQNDWCNKCDDVIIEKMGWMWWCNECDNALNVMM